jgi:hypothetical protein
MLFKSNCYGSDTERKIVEELASLRASSRLYTNSASKTGNVIVLLDVYWII